MKLPEELFKEFFSLKRSKKFSVILTLFSTLISGFILVLAIKPDYIKEFSSLKVVLLSIAIIAPIYLLKTRDTAPI